MRSGDMALLFVLTTASACDGADEAGTEQPAEDAAQPVDAHADMPPPDAMTPDVANPPPLDAAARPPDVDTRDAAPLAPDGPPTSPDASPDGEPPPADAEPPPPRPDRGVIPQCFDNDGDSYVSGGCSVDDDCDDQSTDIYPGAPEICDGLDNDCDFAIDEDINFQTHPLHCGVCGNICAALDPTFQCIEGVCRPPPPVCPGGCERPNALTACAEPGVCVVEGCEDTWWDANRAPDDGCEYQCLVTRDGTEFCDQIDNDCDGETDEICVGP